MDAWTWPWWWLALRLLLMLAAANVAPILAKRWLGERWNAPLDGGRVFVDGRPVLGRSKTWRGLAASVLAGALAAAVLGFAPWLGALLGAASMGGDALASFIKRRLGVAPSGRATGLDQVPEALLGLLAVQVPLQLDATLVLSVTLAFFLLEIPSARWSFRFGWRDRPY